MNKKVKKYREKYSMEYGTVIVLPNTIFIDDIRDYILSNHKKIYGKVDLIDAIALLGYEDYSKSHHSVSFKFILTVDGMSFIYDNSISCIKNQKDCIETSEYNIEVINKTIDDLYLNDFDKFYNEAILKPIKIIFDKVLFNFEFENKKK